MMNQRDHSNRLNVWFHDAQVGYIWRNDQRRIGFCYAESWLSQHLWAISQSLPLQQNAFTPEEGIAHGFFANLLPEGGSREQIVREFKISDNDFSLLQAIGGECAGALSLLHPDHTPQIEAVYYQLSSEDLARLVVQRSLKSLSHIEERSRLSLAGVQHKFPLFVKDGQYYLPLKGSPTSHMIKCKSTQVSQLAMNEVFTTMLAQAIGLPTVVMELCHTIHNTHFILIERYDRYEEDSRIHRLHQEDFCQALGYGHQQKYQQDGGPSFVDCYELVKKASSDPSSDLLHLLGWQIFNVCAGNSDGHAKNLSLLYQPNGEIRLAPFYDLVCTRAIPHIDHHLAFFVGQLRDPGVINVKHFQDLAHQCSVKSTFLLHKVEKMASSLLDQLQPIRQHFEQLYGSYSMIQAMEKVMTKQCQNILKRLSVHS